MFASDIFSTSAFKLLPTGLPDGTARSLSFKEPQRWPSIAFSAQDRSKAVRVAAIVPRFADGTLQVDEKNLRLSVFRRSPSRPEAHSLPQSMAGSFEGIR